MEKENKLTEEQRNEILLFLASHKYHNAMRKKLKQCDEKWLLDMIEEVVFDRN